MSNNGEKGLTSNLILIILDNGSYGTTGYQSSYSGKKTDLAAVAKACGFDNHQKVDNADNLSSAIKILLNSSSLGIIHVLIEQRDEKKDLIPLDPITIKNRFIDSLKHDNYHMQ